MLMQSGLSFGIVSVYAVSMEQAQKSLYQDEFFRRIVVGSTGLGFAAMVGSLAALHMSPSGTFQFDWRWIILPWMGIAAALNWFFWKALWDYQLAPERNRKIRLIGVTVLMVALGFGSFLYPIRYLALAEYGPVIRGLATAALFLGVAGWMVYVLGRGMVAADAVELKRVNQPLAQTDSKAV